MAESPYHAETAKFLASIAENMPKIPADVMQGWIDNPIALREVLQIALCPKHVVPDPKPWKTIKLGVGPRNVDELRRVLREVGGLSNKATDMLGRLCFEECPEEREANLTVVTLAGLGLREGANLKEIYLRAQELGLMLCSAEVGPQLRLQYQKQPHGEHLCIGMAPIECGPDDAPSVFCVKNGGDGVWLATRTTTPNTFFSSHDAWVFSYPQ